MLASRNTLPGAGMGLVIKDLHPLIAAASERQSPDKGEFVAARALVAPGGEMGERQVPAAGAWW